MIKKINKIDLIPIAKFGKTYGLKGEITLVSFSNPIKNILNYQSFFNQKGEQVLLTLNFKNKKIIGKISQKESVNDVKDLVNTIIYIRIKDLPALQDGEFYWDELIGLNVIDKKGLTLGKVHKIENHGATDLIFIQTESEELIIPYVDEFIEDVSPSKNLITVNWFAE